MVSFLEKTIVILKRPTRFEFLESEKQSFEKTIDF